MIQSGKIFQDVSESELLAGYVGPSNINSLEGIILSFGLETGPPQF